MPNRKGFSLIDFLIVVVMIGILAAIAISEVREHKGRSSAGQQEVGPE
jgi:prepilin-type N-terminal cleavage/methylation domain-containing protein